MNTKTFKTDEMSLLRISSIADKYECSTNYVYKVLKGEREPKSVLAQKIIRDANDMLEILNRETKITV